MNNTIILKRKNTLDMTTIFNIVTTLHLRNNRIFANKNLMA